MSRLDSESKENLISTMTSMVDDIANIDSYIIICGLSDEQFMITFNGDTEEMHAMMCAILDKLSDDMDVVNYSHFLLQFNMFARRLMEKKYGSESELEEKDK